MISKSWILGLLLNYIATPLIAAPIVYFDFNGDGLQDTTTSAVLGNTVTAALYVSNVDSMNGGLVSWGVEINFSQSLLFANSYSTASSWPLMGVNNNIDNSTGTVELLANSFTAQTGTIKLADIIFDTQNTGLASITLDEIYPGLTSFSGFTAADGHDYDPDIDFGLATATINITNIPLPGALILFISGLAGLMGFRKTRR